MTLIAIIVLLLPGLLISTAMRYPGRDPSSWIAVVACTALGTWITSFWLLRLVPLTLGQLVAVVATASLLGLAIRRVSLRAMWFEQLEWSGPNAWPLLALMFVVLVRFLPMYLTAAPPGADMSMHSYITRLILDRDGVPGSFHPLLPIDDFGAYAVGLSAVSALLAKIAGLSAVRATYALACAAHALLTVVVYAYCRRHTHARHALLAAVVVTFAVKDPQGFFHWGGNTTVLALVLVAQGLTFLDAVLNGEQRWSSAAAGGALCFSAAALSHQVLPYAMVYYGAALVLVQLYRRPRPDPRALLARVGMTAGLTLAFTVPYLLELSLPLSEGEIGWVLNWQRETEHAVRGPAWLLPAAAIFYVQDRLGFLFFALLLPSTIWVGMKHRSELAAPLVGMGVLLLLVANAEVWVLPASYALYPDRIITLMILPGSLIMIRTLEALERKRFTTSAPFRLSGSLLIVGAILYHGWKSYLAGTIAASVTENDLAAIEWIEQNSLVEDVIENNYGDAGLWIPALAGRAVLNGHVNVVYLEEVKPWQDRTVPRFAFLGERQVYDGNPVSATRGEHPNWIERFRRGEAVVFERVAP